MDPRSTSLVMREASHLLSLFCCVQLLCASATWTSHGSDAAPAPRARHAMASQTGRLWLFAGSAAGQRFNDLWMFNMELQVWFEFARDAETSPPAMEDHIAVWDPGGLALWIFGGYDGTDFLQELWRFTAGSWTRWPTSVVRPGRRAGHVAAWDDASAALWIHGGYDGVDLYQDTWRFDSQAAEQAAGLQGWSRISSVSTAMPSARAKHVGAWDPAGAFWIHGGYNGSVCNDLWKLQVGTSLWHRVAPATSPGRAYHAAAFDATGTWWIHGGVDESFRAEGDLWRFDTASHTWFQLSLESAPGERYNHVASWDGGLWIHGGQQPPGGSMDLSSLWSYESNAAFTSLTDTSTLTSSTTSTTTSTATRSSIATSTVTTSTATSTVTTSTATSTVTSTSGVAAEGGLNLVSLTILLVACVACVLGLPLLLFRSQLKRLLTPSKTVIMPMQQTQLSLPDWRPMQQTQLSLRDWRPMQQTNTQPLREPAISLPLPVPLVPMAVEFGDLPALGFGRGECVLHIAEGYYEPMARCRNCQGWISGVSEEEPAEAVETDGVPAPATAAPDVAQAASRPCTWKGPGRKVLRDSQEVGPCLHASALPSPAGKASCLSLGQPQRSVEEPPRSEMIWRCPAQQCASPSINLPGLNLPGPLTMSLTMSELAPVLWPQTVPLPATRTPLPLPGAAAAPATDVPRRPSAPLATQGAELLLEPAMNPDPPGPPPKPGPKVRTWKRPRSTTLGGPYWTAQARTTTPPALKKSPGPAHYDPQDPNIRGWIPGHGFGPPKRP